MNKGLLLAILVVVSSCYVQASLRFVVIGDWGGQPTKPYTTPVELKVAKELGEIANSFDSHFTLALGDNFYDSGVKDENDPRFAETFEDVFTAPSLQSRWYVVAGNHDHRGNVSGQIAYTHHSKRWHFPSEWYTETVTSDTGATVQFIFFDTVVYAGDWPEGIPQPLGAVDGQRAQSEIQWVEDTLKNSTADWVIVCGHYPVWSIAEHGPTQILVKDLKPLLEKYKAALYLNGHDHNLQHIKEDDKDVSYFVVGAAHLSDDSRAHKDDVPAGSLKYFWPEKSSDDGGFATVEVMDKKTMVVTLVEDTGKKLYSYTITNPRAK